jgi:hypothetical protein
MPDKTSRGLFDGFEEYQEPSTQILQAALLKGLVALDANVLLSLYRYNSRTRSDLLAVLARLKESLWIPHQVLREFWRNHESARGDQTRQIDKVISDIQKGFRTAETGVHGWAKNSALPVHERDQILDLVRKGFKDAEQALRDASRSYPGVKGSSNGEDEVVLELARLLDGRVGSAPSVEELAQATLEGQRRIDEKVPPGYADKEKSPDKAIGDYLLWSELLSETERQRCDVVLVTGDEKEDWWRNSGTPDARPRRELVRELFDISQTRLFLVTPSQLLTLAPKFLDVQVDEHSAEEATRVEESLSSGQAHPGRRYLLELLPEGRSVDYVNQVAEMARLAEGDPKYDDYVALFQERFPPISNTPEARKRVRVLSSLGLVDGLAHPVKQVVSVTSSGRKFLEEPNKEDLASAILSRIMGAQEIYSMALEVGISGVRSLSEEELPRGVSPTQLKIQLRWMQQLGMLD